MPESASVPALLPGIPIKAADLAADLKVFQHHVDRVSAPEYTFDDALSPRRPKIKHVEGKGDKGDAAISKRLIASAPKIAQHLSGPTSEALEKFSELDVDGSGSLDQDEIRQLFKALNIPKRHAESAWMKMTEGLELSTENEKPQVTFAAFSEWWNSVKEMERRSRRRQVKDVFNFIDADNSGRLNKEEFGKLASKAKHLLDLDPPFDLETDWARSESKRLGAESLSYPAFELWWQDRLGLDTPDIPVLPEFMVQSVAHHSELEEKRARQFLSGAKRPGDDDGRRSAAHLWWLLRTRLLKIVSMQRHWGALHSIYDSTETSRFSSEALPLCIRDPDSDFSAIWDLAQVVLLLYVAISVPLRASFGVEIEVWTSGFFLDLAVDLYFVADLVLNFRTAFHNGDGTREERPLKIAHRYIKGWFFIDLFSCLPISYVTYLLENNTTHEISAGSHSGAGGWEVVKSESTGSTFRGLKTLRLIKLSKMLRLARIKKILSKYGGDVNLQVYVSIGFTVSTIFFLVHVLTCGFYVVGKENQTLPNGIVVQGWVDQQQTPPRGEGTWDPTIGLATRYVASAYFCLNALENSNTDAERWFALAAEFVRDLILGMVAGLLTTITMTMNGGEQEGHHRLRALKGWMQKKNLPRSFQMPMIQYCNELWNNRSGVDLDDLLSNVPPLMRTNLMKELYGATIRNVPMFRGLSEEVFRGLCSHAKPMYVLPNQIVMKQGEPGREMYMIISGEMEVLQEKDGRVIRLGFLSENSFFGESAVLSRFSSSERRQRTVRSVTEAELCFLTSMDLKEISKQYSELAARLLRFERSGEGMTKKRVARVFGVGDQGKQLLQEYTEQAMEVQSILKSEQKSGMDDIPVSLSEIRNALKAKRGFLRKIKSSGAYTAVPPPLVSGRRYTEKYQDHENQHATNHRLEQKLDQLMAMMIAMQSNRQPTAVDTKS